MDSPRSFAPRPRWQACASGRNHHHRSHPPPDYSLGASPRTFPHGWSTGASSRATRCRLEIPTTTMMRRRRRTTNRTTSRLSLENPTNRAKDLMSWLGSLRLGNLDRRCPARPADRGLLLLNSPTSWRPPSKVAPADAVHSRTSYSNATPSGSCSSNHLSAASTLAKTFT